MAIVRTWTARDRVISGQEFDLDGSAAGIGVATSASFTFTNGDPFSASEPYGQVLVGRGGAWLLPSPSDHVAMSCWIWNVNSVNNDNTCLALANSNGYVSLGLAASPNRVVVRDGASTIEAEADVSPTNFAAWHFVEWSIERLDATTARAIVRYDQQEVIDAVIDHSLGSDPIDRAAIRAANSTTTSRSVRYAHLVVDDEGTLRGPIRIFSLRPDVQGFHDEWTPANSPARVDNAPPNTNEIVGAAGDRTTYTTKDGGLLADQFGSKAVKEVFAVNVRVLGSSSGDGFRPLTRRGSDDESGPLTTMGALLAYHGPLAVDPHTSLPWELADAVSDEWGILADSP